MPISHAGGVDLELTRQAGLVDDAPEHALRHGRAADIPQTNEEDAVFRHDGSHRI
jgi:hypothetical protein